MLSENEGLTIIELAERASEARDERVHARLDSVLDQLHADPDLGTALEAVGICADALLQPLNELAAAALQYTQTQAFGPRTGVDATRQALMQAVSALHNALWQELEARDAS